MYKWFASKIGRLLAGYLEKPLKHYKPVVVSDVSLLKEVMEPGDVLLVEGELRVSSAIKYLTQSTWSHSAIYVGDLGDKKHMVIEADMTEGVRAISLDYYSNFNLRVCRPHQISEEDCKKVVAYMLNRLGDSYDLDNIFDLIRYLLPNPPVPSQWRRGLLELGSGEPTKAICSTVIAQAFHSIGYPILPRANDRLITHVETKQSSYMTVFRKRHHSLFVPRDFDLSPYFKVVKPTLQKGFNYKSTIWEE